MKNYKNSEEAAKAYADLLQIDTNTEQGKLRYESACLDFVAGANWKNKQLRLSNVKRQRELLIRDYIIALKDKYEKEYDINACDLTTPPTKVGGFFRTRLA